MRARDAAVSAVSLALKNADSSKQHDDGGNDQSDFEGHGSVHFIAYWKLED